MQAFRKRPVLVRVRLLRRPVVLVTVRYPGTRWQRPPSRRLRVRRAHESFACGYLAVTPDPDLTLVTVMAVAAQALFVFVLAQVPKFVKGGFYPSFAAMTFPFVITATALDRVLGLMASRESSCPRSSTGSSSRRSPSPPAWSPSSSPTTPASWGKASSQLRATCADEKPLCRRGEVERIAPDIPPSPSPSTRRPLARASLARRFQPTGPL